MGNSLANHYTIARMGAKTKIVCTLGPACSTPEALRALVEAGGQTNVLKLEVVGNVTP